MVAVETLDRYADECLSFSDWWESMEPSMLESRMFCKGKKGKDRCEKLHHMNILLVIKVYATVANIVS